MYDLNLVIPQISSDKYSVDRKFALLKNYLYELNEALAVALESKSATVLESAGERVSQAEQKEEAHVIQLKAQSLKRFEELRGRILSVAEDIQKDYTTAIQQSEKEILQTAAETYTAKTEFEEYQSTADSRITQNAHGLELVTLRQESISTDLEEFKKETNSEFLVQSDAILSQVEKAFSSKTELGDLEERISSQITQTSDNITEIFSENVSRIGEDISSVGGTVQELMESLDVYIRRGELEEGVYGIEIGRTDSEIKARFTNERLSFVQGSSEVAYISGSNLYITRAEVLDYLKIGDSAHGYFIFDITQNGLEVRWTNGN